MKLVDRVKSFFGTTGSFVASWIGGSSPWSRRELLQQYKGYVYPIVTAIAEDMGKIEFVIKNKAGRELTEHPFLSLMAKPNPDTSQFSLIEQSVTHLELVGEFFWYLVPTERSRVPTQIYLLRPDLMEVVPGDDSFGLVAGYTMTKPDGGQVPFDRDEILHVKLPNPINPYRGMGPLEAAAVEAQTGQLTSDWSKNSMLNGGTPSGILAVKGNMDESKFKEFKKRVKDEYAGSVNAAKIMIIKGMEIEYEKMGMGLDAKVIETLKKLSRDDLMMIWRVHKNMLGISEDVNLSNAREGRIAFLENVIEPKMWRLVDAIQAHLIDRWGRDVKLDFKSPVPETAQERTERYTAGYNKWLATNEIRREIGQPDVQGGDALYRPMSEVPVMEPKAKKITIAKKIVHKQEIPREQKNEIFRKQQFIRQEQWQKRYQSALNIAFNEQKEEVLKGQKALDGWTFDKNASRERMISLLVPMTREFMTEQGNAALAFAGSDLDFFLTESAQEAVRERVARFADEVNTDIQDKIAGSISEGMQAGESQAKLRKRVEELYGGVTRERSNLIARTETIYASGKATVESYKQTGFVNGMEWIPEPDACVYCAVFTGKIIGLDDSFAKDGESVIGTDNTAMSVSWGDVDHPPLHPNCRCALAPVTEFSTVRSAKVERMKKKYDSMDKRTKEAKELLESIQQEREQLEQEKRDFKKEVEETRKDVKKLTSLIDE